MTRDDLQELHNIQHLDNLVSILTHGILSHSLARKISHVSVASDVIQGIRTDVIIPNGQQLHEYASLYINARNAMMFKLTNGQDRDTLCVFRVSLEVLGLSNVVVTDQNAASGYARFSAPDAGLALLAHDYIFSRYWVHPENQISQWRHKAAMCAEVLVPGVVTPEHIIGVYVPDQQGYDMVRSAAPDIAVQINADLFFR